MGPHRRGRLLWALALLSGCGPSALPRSFKAAATCPLNATAFGVDVLGSDAVVSLFDRNSLRRIKLSDCSTVSEWQVGAGPKAVVALGTSPVELAAAASGISALSLASADGTSTSVLTTPVPLGLLGADLDGDGVPELIATLGASAAEARVGVWRASGGGWVATANLPVTGASALASADLDGDQDLDGVVAQTTEGTLTILTNQAGTLTAGAPIPVCAEPFSITATKLDHPLPSLVVTCRTGGLELLHPTGGGYSRQPLRRDGTLYQTVVADFDRDGRSDLVSIDPFANRLVVWWGRQSGGFDGPDELGVGGGPILLRTLDFDMDGQPDLLVLAFQDRTLTVFRNTGATR